MRRPMCIVTLSVLWLAFGAIYLLTAVAYLAGGLIEGYPEIGVEGAAVSLALGLVLLGMSSAFMNGRMWAWYLAFVAWVGVLGYSAYLALTTELYFALGIVFAAVVLWMLTIPPVRAWFKANTFA